MCFDAYIHTDDGIDTAVKICVQPVVVIKWVMAIRITILAIWRLRLGGNLQAELQRIMEVQIYRCFGGESAMPQKNIPEVKLH
jgi:hypothetical protein